MIHAVQEGKKPILQAGRRYSRSWKGMHENRLQKELCQRPQKTQRNKTFPARIQQTILEIEAADSITTVKNLKKLKAEGSYYIHYPLRNISP